MNRLLSRSSLLFRDALMVHAQRISCHPMTFVMDMSTVDDFGRDTSKVLEKRMAAVLGNNVSQTLDKYQDIQDFSLILKLYPLGSFSPEFTSLFEESLLRFLSLPDRVYELSDLTYLFHLISNTKRRPIKVMRKISQLIVSDHVTDEKGSRSRVKMEYITLMINGMNKTAFMDVELMNKLCDILASDPYHLRDVKKNSMTSLLIALGQMRFRHQKLLDSVFAILSDTSHSRKAFNSAEICSLISSLARVNYKPPNFDVVCVKHILPNIGMNDITEAMCIDVAWALAFLKKIDSHVCGFLLNPKGKIMVSIRMRIIHRDPGVWSDVAKILNIRSIAVNEMGIQCPDIELPVDRPEKPQRSTDCTTFASSVIETLNLFIPKGSHMQTGVLTEHGFEIDARFCINTNLKSMNLEDMVKCESGGLPDGYSIVNVLTSSFRTRLLSDNTQVTGQVELQRRLIRDVMKQQVVIVDAPRFMAKADAVSKVNFLQELIREALVQL